MKRLPGATGFNGQSAPVASSRLIDAVVAALALSAVSVSLVLCFNMLTTKASVATSREHIALGISASTHRLR